MNITTDEKQMYQVMKALYDTSLQKRKHLL